MKLHKSGGWCYNFEHGWTQPFSTVCFLLELFSFKMYEIQLVI